MIITQHNIKKFAEILKENKYINGAHKYHSKADHSKANAKRLQILVFFYRPIAFFCLIILLVIVKF